MRLRSLIALAGLALPLLASSAPQCIAMADADTGEWLVHEGDCGLRQPPMSTFKIAISLMGYDSGILRDAHAPRLPFKEGYVDWNPSWRQATDPTAWMKNSVVWYSQQVTGMLGAPRFDAYVRRFGYGNVDVSGDAGKQNGLSNAWLGSSLRISADEQVSFLRRVVKRELDLTPQAHTETAALLRLPEAIEGWQVHGKTGSGSPVLANGAPDKAHRLGWYVGWLSKGARRIVFAQMAIDERTDGGPAGLRVKEAFLRALPGRLTDFGVRSAVDAAILPLIEQHRLPGMAVAVTRNGKPYYFNYGIASLESGEPVSERTLFELGSVSKTFTAMLATYAQVQGKLDLGAHPSRYLPSLKGSAIDKATLLDLGTYTAGGLPLQIPDEVEEANVERYFRDWTPSAPPGTQRVYSNPSIGLLGHATALALKRDFTDALEHLVFPGLGLENTYVNVPPSAAGRFAWGYNESGPVRVAMGPLAVPAYGVKSTASDLLRFIQANIDPSGLAPDMRRAVEGTQVPYYQAGSMAQGLGWEQYPYPVALERLLAESRFNRQAVAVRRVPAAPAQDGAVLFHKTGSTNGFAAYAVFVPARRIGIVMLANRNYPNVDRFKAAHAILSQLAP